MGFSRPSKTHWQASSSARITAAAAMACFSVVSRSLRARNSSRYRRSASSTTPGLYSFSTNSRPAWPKLRLTAAETRMPSRITAWALRHSMSMTRLTAPAPLAWPVRGLSPVVRIQLRQVGVISTPPERLPRVRPTPWASLYTSKLVRPLLSLASWSSSRQRGRLFRKAAVFSRPTTVPSKVLTYSPTAGFPHTLAATIRATVFPVPESTPHRWTKNGRHPRGSNSGEAKEAASTILAVTDIPRTSRATSFHFSKLPRLRTVWNIAEKFASPSKISPSTKGEKPASGM